MDKDREEREMSAVRELELSAHRAADASRTLRWLAIFGVVLAFAIGLLWHPSWAPLPEAHGTTRPAAAPELDYSTGENPRWVGRWREGQPIYVESRYASKRWHVKAAVRDLRRATGLDIRSKRCPSIVWNLDGSPNRAKSPSCVTVLSDRDRYTGPTGRRLGDVQLWTEWGVLVSANVDLDDKDGKRAGKAKRDQTLRHYIARAVGLTQAEAARAVR